MDKQTIAGFVLIAIVFTVWMIYSSSQIPEQPKNIPAAADTTAAVRDSASNKEAVSKSTPAAAHDSLAPSTDQMLYGQWFANAAQGEDRWFTVETEKYTVVFNTKGGGIKRWTLKGFQTWNKQPLQLVDWMIPSDLSMLFGTMDGKLIDTRLLYFRFDNIPASGEVVLKDSATFRFQAVLPVRGDSMAIVKTYTVRSGGYAIDVDLEMRNMGSVIANSEYQVTIHSPALTEQNSVDEAGTAKSDAFVAGERRNIDASKPDEEYKENLPGETHWVTTHNKYFLNALIGRGEFVGSGAYLEGIHLPLKNNAVREVYQASVKVKYRGQPIEKSEFTYFMGPMKYDVLKSQHEGLEQVIDLGWTWIVRPFSEYLIIPLFSFLNSFIPNYGVVIIIFTILIKLLLYPLTKSSMQSMRKMQALQPLMNEIREKYKDDQQRQNTETMKLYKDYGINPAGGCLPLLLQMPILFALFAVFRTAFQLRQQPFIWWMTDLSTPDVIVRLPFTLPIMGSSAISGLALAMAVTMFVQQKQTVKDPRQKMMIYVMPIMFWVMFNGFPSGLNLYYFLFNVLSIGQQWYTTHSGGEVKLEKVDAKKRNKKGWAERAMQSLEQKAKDQQKSTRKK